MFFIVFFQNLPLLLCIGDMSCSLDDYIADEICGDNVNDRLVATSGSNI